VYHTAFENEAPEAGSVHPGEQYAAPDEPYAGPEHYAPAEQYAAPDPYAAGGAQAPEGDWRTAAADYDYSPEELQQYIAAQELAREQYADAGHEAAFDAASDQGYGYEGPAAATPGGEPEEPHELSSQMALQAFEAHYDQNPEVPLGSFEEPGEQPFFDEGQRDAEFLVPDEVSQETPPAGERKSRRVLMFASGLIGALALGGALAFAYKTGGDSQLADGSTPPLIKADDGPVKVAPDEPGGKEFPHQNKQIYDRLENNGEPEGERLVSREEEVASLPESPGGSDDGSSRPGQGENSGDPQAAQFGQTDQSGNRPEQSGQDQRASAPAQSGTGETNDGGPHKVRTLQIRPDGSVVTTQEPQTEESQPQQESGQRAGAGQQASTQNAGTSSPGANQQSWSGRQEPRVPDLPDEGETPPGVAVTMPSTSGGQTSGQDRADPTTVASVDASRQQSGESSSSPQPQQAQEANASAAPLPQPKPSAPPQSTQTASTGGGSNYVVQVASRRSQAMALAAFADLQQKYTDLLGDYQPMIQSADLGDKGVWYRLRVGPMNREQEAQSLCDNLKKAGLRSCLVRPQ
jgi:hypothetical protein